MMKQLILLYDINGVFLVIERNTGVVYQNQVGGTACFQAEQEGIIVPLGDELIGAIETHDFLDGRQGITVDSADFIDAILHANATTKFLSVDRSRLHESLEAWIYVTWSPVPDEYESGEAAEYYGPMYGFDAGRGVLTWPNSD